MFDFNTQSSNELLISAIFHILCYIWMIYFLKNTILFANLAELEEKKLWFERGVGRIGQSYKMSMTNFD